jgi:hypothetical protein
LLLPLLFIVAKKGKSVVFAKTPRKRPVLVLRQGTLNTERKKRGDPPTLDRRRMAYANSCSSDYECWHGHGKVGVPTTSLTSPPRMKREGLRIWADHHLVHKKMIPPKKGVNPRSFPSVARFHADPRAFDAKIDSDGGIAQKL